MSTPPPTALDTPSPTERAFDDFTEEQTQTTQLDEMSKLQNPIYLIVATAVSPPLGIGLKGTLPWPQIRSDMAFFRKVTTGHSTSDTRNAVIMGRRTWESIPAKFRPLPGRINIILTRAEADGVLEMGTKLGEEYRKKERLQTSDTQFSIDNNEDGTFFTFTPKGDRSPSIGVTNSLRRAVNISQRPNVGTVFCIGGAEIYKMVLQDEQTKSRVRVLQTQVKKVDGSEFECDTFFPEKLQDDDGRWKEARAGELMVWIDSDLPQGIDEWARDEKAGVDIKVVGWSPSKSQ
jgi:dihydrofolate reductase